MDNIKDVGAGLIKPINKNVVHQICSGQVILTLAIAVKELVENSIDAGATIIDITMKEYGSEVIEVSDNGKGVLEDNFQALTLKHYTSKIQDFSDLQCLQTLGFRGEALSSLCALADLSIVTKHHSADETKKICYDKNGKIMKVSLAARESGTTVILENLFSTLPVRRKEFMKNLKREFNKMLQLLYAYCLVSKGIKFTCVNITNNGNKNVIVATQGLFKVRENIISVFGAKQISALIDIEVTMPNQNILEEYHIKSIPHELPFELEFLISSITHGNGRSSTDRQFFYVNSRPVEPTKIIKLVNQIYKQFNTNQYPFVYLNIILKDAIVDVNVTPDKRQIFIEKENIILSIIKSSLLESFRLFPSRLPVENQNISQILKFSKTNEEKKGIKRNLSDSVSTKGFLNNFRKKTKSDGNICNVETMEIPIIHDDEVNRELCSLNEDKLNNSTVGINAFSPKSQKVGLFVQKMNNKSLLDSSITTEISSCYLRKNPAIHLTDSSSNIDVHLTDAENFSQKILDSEFEEVQENYCSLFDKARDTANEKNLEASISSLTQRENTSGYTEFQCDVLDSIDKTKYEIREDLVSNSIEIDSSGKNVDESEDIEIILDAPSERKFNHKSIQLNISLDVIRKSLENNCTEEYLSLPVKVKFRSPIDPENNKKAEEELQKQLSKRDFLGMSVIGQFNLGFIVTKLGNDLFIIDQHATDEKYNFEQLQSTTVLQKQFLVNPKPLELTAGNESVLIENEEIFKRNGFHFKIDKNAPCTKKIFLTAVPVSHNLVFGKDDIDEMLFMLKDCSQTMCRPSRLRAMFASRACRKSVMIGKSLSIKDMMQLVLHMGEIEQPWNCPHGRPTIRHLINLDLLVKGDI